MSRIASENDRLLKEARQMRIDYASLEAEIKVLRSTATEATLAEAKEAAKTARQKSEAELEQVSSLSLLALFFLPFLLGIHSTFRRLVFIYKHGQKENDSIDVQNYFSSF